VIDTTAPTVTASPVGGTYNTAKSVTLTASETSTIYYTTDGSTPTTASTRYTGPITINTEGTTTLKFFGVDTAGNAETVQTQTYVIDTTPPTVTASPVGGTYNTAKSVILTASETSTIYYTTDGSTPTTSSTVYTGPITISSSKTLKFFGVDTAGNAETVQTQTYVIDTTPPTVTSIVPNNLATGVSRSTTVTVTFSETMDHTSITTVTFTLTKNPGGAETGTISPNTDGTTYTFTPTSQLQANKNYIVTITTSVKDKAGNSMASTFTSTFTTGP
jgi:Bacterial Ig-like domain/Chitobiase/beta-hexosaminidase C-terminal domain